MNLEVNYPNNFFREVGVDAAKGEGSSEPWVSQLLYATARALDARRILEIGTFHGATTIWLALAAEQTRGKVTCIDKNEEYLEITRQNLARMGLLHTTDLRQGDMLDLLTHIPPSEMYDFAFFDACHEINRIRPVFEPLWNHIEEGGILAIHDVFNPRCDERDIVSEMFPQAIMIRGEQWYANWTMDYCGVALVQKGQPN